MLFPSSLLWYEALAAMPNKSAICQVDSWDWKTSWLEGPEHRTQCPTITIEKYSFVALPLDTLIQ